MRYLLIIALMSFCHIGNAELCAKIDDERLSFQELRAIISHSELQNLKLKMLYKAATGVDIDTTDYNVSNFVILDDHNNELMLINMKMKIYKRPESASVGQLMSLNDEDRKRIFECLEGQKNKQVTVRSTENKAFVIGPAIVMCGLINISIPWRAYYESLELQNKRLREAIDRLRRSEVPSNELI